MPSAESESIVACALGRVAYEPAWELQQRIQDALIRAKRATPPEPLPHVLLLVEHPHVYTLGKSGDADHLLIAEERLDAIDAEFHHIDRGGDVTYHGPGQIVGYPIFDLDRFFTDLGKYLRTLEEIVIRTCADYGVDGGTRVEGRTGTWIGPDERGPERKICAMGVRCSRWVTMHGFAFNVNTDLSYFDHIVPCGIADRGVTSLQKELDRPADPLDEAAVRERLLTHTATLFDADVTPLSGADAHAFLDDFLPQEPLPIADSALR
jgi:lipoyl(octanoyl) transferase